MKTTTIIIHSFNNLSKIIEELKLAKCNRQNCYKHANKVLCNTEVIIIIISIIILMILIIIINYTTKIKIFF